MDGRFLLGSWLVEPSLNTVSSNGNTIRLEPKVMEVLVCLAEHTGDVVSKEQLLERVWPDTFVGESVLTRSISELRRVFEDDAKESRVIQTIPKRGYRMVAAVTPVDGMRTKISQPVLDSTRELPEASHRRIWKVGIAGSTVLLAGLLVALNVSNLRGRLWDKTDIPQIRSVAVLPLKNLSGDPSQEYFSDGMTDELITYLSQISGLRVISYTSVQAYKDTKKTLPQVARELGVDAIVEGSVQRAGEKVRVNAQLIYAPQERHLWAQSYDRDLHDALTMQSAVASAIADQVKIKLTPSEQLRLQASRPVNLKALEAYLQGDYHLNRFGNGFSVEETQRAIQFFQQAIAEDPGFVAAYVKLCWAYENERAAAKPPTSGPNEKAAAEKAFDLDPNSSDVHVALANVRLNEWNLPGFERELRRALELNANNGLAHDLLGDYLDIVGRTGEGMREHERAQELDPTNDHISNALTRTRQYDLLLDLLQRQVKLNPNNGLNHMRLAGVYARRNMRKEWIEEQERFLVLFGYSAYADRLRRTYTYSGYRGALQDWARILEEVHAGGQVDRPYMVASAYVNLGETDQAFRWLERAYREHDPDLLFLKVDPDLDPITSDPRFQNLVRRVGLPQ